VNLRRAAVAGAGVAGGAGALYLLQRAVAGRWRVGAGELAAAGLSLPPDLRHHFVTTSDGGRVHVVERGEGPTVVLVHGIMLGVATWAPQLRALPGRVVAVSQRGHGQSRAGTDGYAFDRLAADLVEVLTALDVQDAVLVGHSMGGMIAQLVALTRPDDLAGRVRRVVLVSTAPGPVLASPIAAFAGAAAARALGGAERRGSGPLPKSATVWGARLAFGVAPSAADVELLRGMLDAMSPGALGELLPHLLAFDVRAMLGSLAFPVHVVVGSRDLLTPPRTARGIAQRVAGSRLTVLPGCGHMVMLERAATLCDLVAG
jgi:pimeloyl-ACP methyl ester carboxylesterase